MLNFLGVIVAPIYISNGGSKHLELAGSCSYVELIH